MLCLGPRHTVVVAPRLARALPLACSWSFDRVIHGVRRTSITMAVSPSSMSAFARSISLRQHVELLRKAHRDLAATVSSLFSDRSRTCEEPVSVVVIVVIVVGSQWWYYKSCTGCKLLEL